MKGGREDRGEEPHDPGYGRLAAGAEEAAAGAEVEAGDAEAGAAFKGDGAGAAMGAVGFIAAGATMFGSAPPEATACFRS